MITAVQSYTNFNGIRNVKPQKVARKVVNMEKNAPKGIFSPLRREDALDELENALDKRFDNSNTFEKASHLSVLGSTVIWAFSALSN